MAKEATTVPDSATLREPELPEGGEDRLRAAIEEFGDEYAAAAEYTDEIENVLKTTVLVLSSADDEEVARVTESVVSLVKAGDALGTEGTVELAEALGENADEFAPLLDDVLRLQSEGHLSKFVQIAEALAEPLDQADAERLADTVGENADEIADLLDRVMEMQQAGELEALLDLASTLSAVEVDEDTARGLTSLLSAVGEAERTSEPVGLLGLFGALSGRNARAGLGYVVEVLKGVGSRVR